MEKDFIKGDPAKLILLFTISLLIGNVFQQLYSTVDSIIVGNFVGPEAFGAIVSSQSIQFLIFGAAFGFAMGASVILTQVYGARNYLQVLYWFNIYDGGSFYFGWNRTIYSRAFSSVIKYSC